MGALGNLLIIGMKADFARFGEVSGSPVLGAGVDHALVFVVQ